MNIHIIAVGRLKAGPEQVLIDTYAKRCPWKISITEVEEKKRISGSERMAREGELLLNAVPNNAAIIVLDERGKEMRSTDFASKIQNFQNMGKSSLAFLIGGADGHDQKVKDRADLILSIGQMTWPHMMVRAMLVEQLYRASTIIQGHPYHKD